MPCWVAWLPGMLRVTRLKQAGTEARGSASTTSQFSEPGHFPRNDYNAGVGPVFSELASPLREVGPYLDVLAPVRRHTGSG
jgi:hypothetical protein